MILIRRRNGVNVPYLTPALLATTAHYMGEAEIVVMETFHTRVVFFTTLLANQSTGKTQALSIFSTLAHSIEKALNIPHVQSRIANCATIEGTIELLSKETQLITYNDEFASFIGGMGRYNNGGKEFDRSVFLQLFNAPQYYKRDLKQGRTQCNKPLLNITSLGN